MTNIWKWLGSNHSSIQAVTAIFAALLALGTVVTVKWQIDAAARLQQQQSARDIYREYLAHSIARPEFAAPNYCALSASPQLASYEAYVAYMLYAAEQVHTLGDGWPDVIESEIGEHSAYLCSDRFDADDYDLNVAAIVDRVNAQQCAAINPCGAEPKK